MAFGDSAKKTTERSTDGSIVRPYITFQDGKEVIVRILDAEEVSFWRYWMPVTGYPNGVGINVARENPIKTYMDSIGEGNPGFSKPSKRFVINVLERVPLLDSKGELEIEDGNPIFISNTVKILEMGPSLMEALAMKAGKMRHPRTFKPLATINDADIAITRTGKGRETKYDATQHRDSDPLSEELLTLDRYDLKKMYQPMPNEAIERLLAGEEYNEVRKSLGWGGNYPMFTPSPF